MFQNFAKQTKKKEKKKLVLNSEHKFQKRLFQFLIGTVTVPKTEKYLNSSFNIKEEY